MCGGCLLLAEREQLSEIGAGDWVLAEGRMGDEFEIVLESCRMGCVCVSVSKKINILVHGVVVFIGH